MEKLGLIENEVVFVVLELLVGAYIVLHRKSGEDCYKFFNRLIYSDVARKQKSFSLLVFVVDSAVYLSASHSYFFMFALDAN